MAAASTSAQSKVASDRVKQEAAASARVSRQGLPISINVSPRRVLTAAVLLSAAAVGSYASQLSLGPVYGDIPTSLYHSQICAGIFAAVWAGKAVLRPAVRRPLAILPILAFYIPVIQRYLFKYSEKWGDVRGPIYTEAASFYPALFLVVLVSTYILETPSIVLDVIPAAASYGFFRTVRNWLPGFLASKIGTTWVYTRCGLTNAVAAIYTLINPSLLLLTALPAMYHTGFVNPGCTEYAGNLYLNQTLASSNYTLLARSESITGYVSILQNSYHNYRVMRCDHSLLGGEWIKAPPGYEHLDSGHKEPIYAVFVTLEAVRLIRPAPAAKKPKALMIGLGIGTSQTGMLRHGVETDIVELDPAVYKYAIDYFGLLTNHTAYIEDAVGFVDKRAKQESPELYDYVIHDVFTGGAAPAALFTKEMVEGMSKIMKPDGVIAINYAGDLKLRPAKMIIETARSVFPTCQVYREDLPEEGKAIDFTNMVIFCSKNPKPFRFTRPKESDYLGSLARQRFLFPTYEINLDALFGTDEQGNPVKFDVLTRANQKDFDRMQKESAVGHWGIMRTVMPAAAWENY